MRRIAAITLLLAAVAAGWSAAASADEEVRTYKIEMYNAFGIVEQSEVRVSGVNVGEVVELDVNEDKRAVITVELRGDLVTLGTETQCSSEPQSLIAEYFIDCEPAGEPLEEGGIIPASQVSQTVQTDLVQNTLREPFKQRFRLLINEFGTALAGNSEALNEAIRLGAPALTDLKEVTAVLRDQRETIAELNSDSSEVVGELAAKRNEIADFIDEAEDVSKIGADRRDTVSTNFSLLDDFVGELRPSLEELNRLALAQTPLLEELRGAAPGLARLSGNLPAFNRASEDALRTLGKAGDVGRVALTRGRDEIQLLADAGENATEALEPLGDFVADLDDPRRAVEYDERAGVDTGRTGVEPGRKDTMGYTGLEGLLNYIRYQTLAINQFDQVSHVFRFGIYEANSGLCGSFSSGRDTNTGEPGVPAQAGGTTTDINALAECAAWLGPNQPGLTPGHLDSDLGYGPYDPSVCPSGTSPEPAEALCNPAGPRRASRADESEDREPPARDQNGGDAGENPPGLPELPELPDLDDLPPGAADDIADDLGLPSVEDMDAGAGTTGSGTSAEALLDWLFTP
jgi:virulence factor Mce-like protein